MKKLFACALPLLAGLPSVMVAQVTFSLPRVQRPIVRATPDRTIRRPASPARAPAAERGNAAGILATAKRYLGTRYRYGGESPTTGFDCSGFVQYVFGRHHVML